MSGSVATKSRKLESVGRVITHHSPLNSELKDELPAALKVLKAPRDSLFSEPPTGHLHWEKSGFTLLSLAEKKHMMRRAKVVPAEAFRHVVTAYKMNETLLRSKCEELTRLVASASKALPSDESYRRIVQDEASLLIEKQARIDRKWLRQLQRDIPMGAMRIRAKADTVLEDYRTLVRISRLRGTWTPDPTTDAWVGSKQDAIYLREHAWQGVLSLTCSDHPNGNDEVIPLLEDWVDDDLPLTRQDFDQAWHVIVEDGSIRNAYRLQNLMDRCGHALDEDVYSCMFDIFARHGGSGHALKRVEEELRSNKRIKMSAKIKASYIRAVANVYTVEDGRREGAQSIEELGMTEEGGRILQAMMDIEESPDVKCAIFESLRDAFRFSRSTFREYLFALLQAGEEDKLREAYGEIKQITGSDTTRAKGDRNIASPYLYLYLQYKYGDSVEESRIYLQAMRVNAVEKLAKVGERVDMEYRAICLCTSIREVGSDDLFRKICSSYPQGAELYIVRSLLPYLREWRAIPRIYELLQMFPNVQGSLLQSVIVEHVDALRRMCQQPDVPVSTAKVLPRRAILLLKHLFGPLRWEDRRKLFNSLMGLNFSPAKFSQALAIAAASRIHPSDSDLHHMFFQALRNNSTHIAGVLLHYMCESSSQPAPTWGLVKLLKMTSATEEEGAAERRGTEETLDEQRCASLVRCMRPGEPLLNALILRRLMRMIERGRHPIDVNFLIGAVATYPDMDVEVCSRVVATAIDAGKRREAVELFKQCHAQAVDKLTAPASWLQCFVVVQSALSFSMEAANLRVEFTEWFEDEAIENSAVDESRKREERSWSEWQKLRAARPGKDKKEEKARQAHLFLDVLSIPRAENKIEEDDYKWMLKSMATMGRINDVSVVLRTMILRGLLGELDEDLKSRLKKLPLLKHKHECLLALLEMY